MKSDGIGALSDVGVWLVEWHSSSVYIEECCGAGLDGTEGSSDKYCVSTCLPFSDFDPALPRATLNATSFHNSALEETFPIGHSE